MKTKITYEEIIINRGLFSAAVINGKLSDLTFLEKYKNSAREAAAPEIYIKKIDMSNCGTITELGENFFKGLKNLDNLSLPRNLETISEEPFNECDNLKEIYCGNGNVVKKDDFKQYAINLNNTGRGK